MKKFKKLVAMGLCLTMCTGLLAGCGGNKAEEQQAEVPAEKQTLNVMAMTGPTGIGMVKLISDDEAGTTAVDYNIALVGAADEVSGKIVTGEVDIAAVPCNLASVLYNKTEGNVEVAAINVLGVLYILEGNGGQEIQSVADLKGKTIISTGKGTTPEYSLNYILQQNGLDPEKDVTIEYKSEAAEVATLLASGEAAVAMLPQPMVTTVLAKSDQVRVALDITEEWSKVNAEDGTGMVTGTIIVRKDVLAEKPEAVATFMEEYAQSVAFVNENVEEAAKLVEASGIIPSAAVAQKAIPNCNIVCVTGEDMKKSVAAYLDVLYQANPKAVGGTLPADDFYYLP